MREAWRTHDLERSLPASSMLCGGAVASHSPSQSSPVGRLAAQLQFKNKQKRRTGAYPLPLTRTKGDEAFYRPRGRQHGVPLRVHGSPLQVLQLYSFNFTTVVYWIPTVDRVLISYGFNSYRLRVNKLELELEHFRLEVSVLLLSSLTTAVQKWIQVSQRDTREAECTEHACM